MSIAAIPSDPYTIVAVLFLLLGVPAILFGFLLLYTGYVRYDAEQYLEELEEADLEDDPAAAGAEGAPDDALEGENGPHEPFEMDDDTAGGFQTGDEKTDPGEYSVFGDRDEEDQQPSDSETADE